MKSTAFITILDETVLESEESFDTTVNRLMAQQGICYQKDSQNNPLEFTCTRKGKLQIKSPYRRNNTISTHRTHYVRGEVFVAPDGKTKVSICAVHDRTAVFLRWFEILLFVIGLTLYIFLDFVNQMPVLLLLLELILGIVFLVALLAGNNGERKNKTADMEIMKSEAIRRVEAVNRWDE